MRRLLLFACLFSLVFLAYAEEPASRDAPQGEFRFSADVDRLMKLIINSLYSNRDIFLRELISNAADASNKIRFRALKEPDILGKGELADLGIRVECNEDAQTITITDKGVGMTREELVQNLGTVAHSGTRAFLENMQQGADMGLIGQFGVGFYSAFLVADRVRVVTKSTDDETQWAWESDGSATYSIEADQGPALGRGTQITLYLKEDAKEFSRSDKLKELAAKYSEFTDTPLYVRMRKTEMVDEPIDDDEAPEVPAEDDDAFETVEDNENEDKDADSENENDIEVTEDQPSEADKPRTRKVEHVYFEDERVNEHKAIWLRSPGEVSHEDYVAFYKAIAAKETEDPLAHVHFKGEGEVDFRAILYTPGTAPASAFEFVQKTKNMRLYVQRVLIADEFEDFLPRYLNFIRGVVDSDDLPLNVSRELLQESKLLRQIAKKIVKKILEMFNSIAKRENKEDYAKFWKSFGKHIKVGVLEDHSNKKRLSRLLRFETTGLKPGNLTSLAEYVARMKDDQKAIYYAAGESIAALRQSPFLHPFKKRGVEVLYFTDPLDEYMLQTLREYDGKKFVSITKEGLSLGEDDSKATEELKNEYAPLKAWFEKILKGKIERATVSPRLRDTRSPLVLSTPEYGPSANMERIMKAQALADNRFGPIMARKILEINPMHPLAQSLLPQIQEADPEGDEAKALQELGHLLYDAAAIESGFQLDDSHKFTARLFSVLAHSHVMPPVEDAPVHEAAEPQEAAAAEPQTDEPAAAPEDDIKDEL